MTPSSNPSGSLSHPAQALPSYDWEAFRRSFPVTERWAYFDHAAVAPLPRQVEDAIRQWLDGAVQQGDTVWPHWVQGVERARHTAAAMIQADPAEIAFVPNTTAGITLIAEGLPWEPGDNVVTLANEFPSNQYPWLNLGSRGVETRRVAVEEHAVDLTRLVQAIDARTRVVSVSWVGFATGWRLDLDELAELVHARGALLFIDAIQGLGVFPLDVQRTAIDFLAADGHKWLLGPEGAGLLYIRREHLDRLRPLHVGWNSVVQGSDYSKIELNLRPTAARYEGGSQNMVGTLGLGASLQLLTDFGLAPQQSAIAARVLEFTELACARLAEAGARIVSWRDAAHASGIVAFDWPGTDPQTIRQHCLKHGVVLSCRAGHLRMSPHAYNDTADLERLLECLSHF